MLQGQRLSEEKVEALVQLAGSVAHELNNIFTAVTGNLALLEDSLSGQSDHARVVGDVIRTAHRGIELSEKLQAFAGRQRLRLTRLDLNRAVTIVAADLKRSVLRNIDIRLALHPSGCLVSADEEKLLLVLEELARNAAAAMKSYGWIGITTEQIRLSGGRMPHLPEGDYVRLVMRDSGCGMEPQTVRRAMDPVFSTAGRAGWGLARCAGLVRQCGGDILISSAAGEGTSVEILLPSAT